jgi:hypothetical protein
MRLRDLDDQWLIQTHFFGMYETDPLTGEVYLPSPADETVRLPTSVIQGAIDAAVDRLEKTIQARIRKGEHVVEFHDYDMDLFDQNLFIELRHYPIYSVSEVKLVYGENGADIWDVPDDLIQTHGTYSKFGTIQLLPYRGTIGGGGYDPAAPMFAGMFGATNLPSMLKVTYSYGMDGDDADLDHDIVRAIGLIAAIHPLNILGDLIIGAGISARSDSFDGISQSVTTTASAENSALSARIVQHRRELYGEQSQPGLTQALQTEWRRVPIALL